MTHPPANMGEMTMSPTDGDPEIAEPSGYET
jgi:hypothetical protein